MVLAVLLGQGLETLEPYVLKRMINALSAAVKTGASAAPVTTWFIVGFGLWGAVHAADARLPDRGHQHRAAAAGQGAEADVLLSDRPLAALFPGELRRQARAEDQGGRPRHPGHPRHPLLRRQQDHDHPGGGDDADGGAGARCSRVLLLGWMAIYLAVTTTLARRCVLLSKAFSAAVSTSTGRLIDCHRQRRHRAQLRQGGVRAPPARPLSRRGGAALHPAALVPHDDAAVPGDRRHQPAAASWCGWRCGRRWRARSTSAPSRWCSRSRTSSPSTCWNLSNRMLDFFEQIGTLTEAIELVTQPHEIVDAPGARPLAVSRGAIALPRRLLRPPRRLAAVRQAQPAMAAGEKVALVGPSGAGKSTLVKLLRRHFEPQAGRIVIDGQDIAGVTWDSLNEAIAEVPPDCRHLPPPVARQHPLRPRGRARGGRDRGRHQRHAATSSSCSGRPATTPSSASRASSSPAASASALAIARAILKDARILVLDEATSSLDSESEHRIQEALFALMEGRTVIAIAHRLSTIAGMDRILYLESGRIVEQGSHQALLRLGGRLCAAVEPPGRRLPGRGLSALPAPCRRGAAAACSRHGRAEQPEIRPRHRRRQAHRPRHRARPRQAWLGRGGALPSLRAEAAELVREIEAGGGRAVALPADLAREARHAGADRARGRGARAAHLPGQQRLAVRDGQARDGDARVLGRAYRDQSAGAAGADRRNSRASCRPARTATSSTCWTSGSGT